MSSLAERLKKVRTTLGLTQDELAAKAKVSQSLIGNLESKNQESTSKIAEIAAVLGVHALWLSTGKGEQYVRTNSLSEPAAPAYATLSPDERAMLDTYRKLTKEQRNELLRRAADTQQSNAKILSELAGKDHNGTDG